MSPMAAVRKVPHPLPVIGWREWVVLPELGAAPMKAKIDTGARTSSLHAFDIESFDRDGNVWVRFVIHPVQHRKSPEMTAEARLVDHRSVRSSNGSAEMRPVISTTLAICDRVHPIELTLTNRDAMGFRLLLGRSALRRRYVIDPGRSFLQPLVTTPAS